MSSHVAQMPQNGALTPGTPALVFAERWIAQRQLEGLRLKTVTGYVSILGRLAHVLRAPIADITRPVLAQALAALAKTTTRRGREPAPRTVRNARALLSAIFGAALEEGLIARSPVPHLQLVDVDADPYWRPSNLWEVEELAHLSAERDEWLLSAGLGLRAGELAGLQGRDLHLRDRCLSVARSWSTEGRRYEPVKSGVPRLLPLTEPIAAMLERRVRGPEAPLFPGPSGQPWRNDTLWKALQADCRALGFRSRGHHTFRATLITRLTEAGITDPLIDAITHRSRRGRDALRGYQRPRMAALLEALERVQVKPESARQQSFNFGGRR